MVKRFDLSLLVCISLTKWNEISCQSCRQRFLLWSVDLGKSAYCWVEQQQWQTSQLCRLCAWNNLYLWYSGIFHFCTWGISFLESWLAAGYAVDMVLDRYYALCFQRLYWVYWSTKPWRASASCVHWYADRVGCVLAWWQSVEAAWCGCRGRPAFAYCDWDQHSLSLRGPFPQALTLSGGAKFITWCPS